MPRGGKRPGGGRPKGSKNKATIARELALKTAIEGVDPVKVAADALGSEYGAHELLRALYLNGDIPGDVRFAAAVKALPYEKAKPTANRGQGAQAISFNFGRHVKSA